MIGLLQRVSSASVRVGGETVGEIGPGLLVLVGVDRDDGEPEADRLLERLLTYRVFADEHNRMNLSVTDTDGGLLLVPQFTLVADTCKGTRPGFSRGANPENGRALFDYFLSQARSRHVKTESGNFGAKMQVSLVNEGPVTFWLEVKAP